MEPRRSKFKVSALRGVPRAALVEGVNGRRWAGRGSAHLFRADRYLATSTLRSTALAIA
jgi:hypothetical protein